MVSLISISSLQNDIIVLENLFSVYYNVSILKQEIRELMFVKFLKNISESDIYVSKNSDWYKIAKCLSSLESCDILTQFKIKKMFVTETKFLLN